MQFKQVPPRFAAPDYGDVAFGDAELCGDVFVSAVRCANAVHLVIRQLRQWVLFSEMRARATFRRHVLHVLRVGANPEVRRVTAGWMIAPMKTTQSRGDGAIGQLPRDTMRAVGSPVDCNDAVSAIAPAAQPRPTLICRSLIHQTPKPRGGGFPAFARAKPVGLLRSWRKALAARFARTQFTPSDILIDSHCRAASHAAGCGQERSGVDRTVCAPLILSLLRLPT
jgi:hypothetical protein